ncbi:hypothetical protein ACFL2V_21485 [Pseudomonadota bacterium]
MMNDTAKKIISIVLLILGAYILSDDLFFFLAHFLVFPLEGFPLGLQTLIYALVSINMLGVSWFLICIVKKTLFSHRRVVISVAAMLVIVKACYFSVLLINAYPSFREHTLTFLPLSLETLLFLSGLYLLQRKPIQTNSA